MRLKAVIFIERSTSHRENSIHSMSRFTSHRISSKPALPQSTVTSLVGGGQCKRQDWNYEAGLGGGSVNRERYGVKIEI